MSAGDAFLAAYAEVATETERTRADEATTRAAAAERELAFVNAGVPDNPMGRLLRQSYAGAVDVSDIKLAWAYLREDDSDLTETEKFLFRTKVAGATRPRRGTRA